MQHTRMKHTKRTARIVEHTKRERGAVHVPAHVPLARRDWLMQLPFLLVNFCMAGLLGAAFNSMRMWLWKVRASKTRHLQVG